MGFHNSSGQGGHKDHDHANRDAYVSTLLSKFDIVGTCEFGIDEPMRAAMAAKANLLRGGYKSCFALGTRPKAGMALLVSNRLESTKVELVYADAQEDDPGHTLIAKVNVHGRLPLLVVLSHAPAGTDVERARYFERLLPHIPDVDPRQPERCSVWMGDFNFVESRERSAPTVGAPAAASARARMLDAYAAVRAKLGEGADAALEDAYSLVHPEGNAGTRDSGRRIDRALLDSRLVGAIPGLCDFDHISRHELQVGGRIAPDHAAVRMTLRFSETKLPPAAARYDPRRLSAARASEVEEAVLPLLRNAAVDPEITEQRIHDSVQPLFDRYRKEDRTQHNNKRHKLVSKVDAIEKQLYRARGGERARVRALRAQADRHARALRALVQRAAVERRLSRQRQQWRRERVGGKDLFATMKPERTVTLPVDAIRRTDAGEAHGQEEVADAFIDHFSALLTSASSRPYDADTLAPMLARIANDPTHRLTAEQAAALTPEAMFTAANFLKAMDELAVDTSPGESGITTAFLRHAKWRQLMAEHLSRLAMQCCERGVMTPDMRTSIISVLFKGGAKPRDRCASYRPVSLTDCAYRLLGKVVEMHMNAVIPTILSGRNVGFVPGARAETDTLTCAEVTRYVHDGERRGDGPSSGALVLLDADKAYDRVQIAMLLDTLRAFGFPDEFVAVVSMMYNDLHARMKVNGHVGGAFSILNGLRQGCPASCPLYLCVQEVFILDLEADRSVPGVTIPGPLGVGEEELKTRAYADDTKLFLRSVSVMPQLLRAIARWEKASGQIISAEKLCILLLGEETRLQAPLLPPELRDAKLLRYGVNECDKSVGVRVGTVQQVAEQWRQQAAELEQLALDTTAGRKLAGSTYARSQLVKSCFVSKVLHTFLVQAPLPDERAAVTEQTQKLTNRLVFGKFYNVTVATAQQPYHDGGIAHVEMEERLQAAWTALVTQFYDVTTPAPWKNIWWRHMRESYGDLATPALLRSTCAFELLQQSAAPSEVQKLALQGWGNLPRLQPVIKQSVEPSRARQNDTSRTQTYEWVPGIRAEVTGKQVGCERIWFNACFQPGPHRAFTKSDADSERLAVAWAREGLIELKDIMNGTSIMGASRFQQLYPQLAADGGTLLLSLLQGSAMPPEWCAALGDGTAPTWGENMDESALPRGLLDEAAEPPATRQALHLTYARTLRGRASVEASRANISTVYSVRMSHKFGMPRCFDRSRAHTDGRHAHLYSHIPAGHEMATAVGRSVKCIRHPAVPSAWTETAFAVAHSAFPFGPSKAGICGRDTCPCGCGAQETVHHTFTECLRSKRVWQLTLAQWTDVTGEKKVRAENALVTLLGDRSQTWLDDVEQSEFAALHEPWAVIHKATLRVLHLERNRDAAPNARPRRTAQQLYQRAQHLVQQAVTMLWDEAIAKSRDSKVGSDPRQLFLGRWEAPGFIAIDGAGRAKLLFYMRSDTRKKWKRNILQGCTREQEYAPPAELPPDTTSIFTDGSAIYDKAAKAWTAAGFGLAAVVSGSGHEHIGGIPVHEHCGPIKRNDEGVENLTNNVAEVIAFIHALRFSRTVSGAVVLRYDSKYAALITTGVYKAKKNKRLVRAAQDEWKRTVAMKRGTLWMRHVKGHSDHKWNDMADALADIGRGGGRRYGAPSVD